MQNYKETYGKIAALLILFIFGLTNWFFVLPYITSVVEKVQLKSELREQVTFSNNSDAMFDEMIQYKKELEQGILKVQRNTLNEGESYVVIDRIYSVSEESDIQLISIDPGDIQGSGNSIQNIELILTGRYHVIAGFINNLENSNFPVTIPEFQLSKGAVERMLLAELTLQVNYNED